MLACEGQDDRSRTFEIAKAGGLRGRVEPLRQPRLSTFRARNALHYDNASHCIAIPSGVVRKLTALSVELGCLPHHYYSTRKMDIIYTNFTGKLCASSKLFDVLPTVASRYILSVFYE
ncbi:hypothetical protein Zmor_014716 [Zophobas morio]|uniref:Uncharacterized protein n=1 Tax=Zophobas morio TaxID=2755281 RepID=A0AA38II28_9CUCU|nr:hypothetical protein Zmor_014716 [Zophobas morio]